MLKNAFALIGFAFTTILIVISVAAMGLFYDRIGLVTLPENLPILSQFFAEQGEVSVRVAGSEVDRVEWNNPLDLLPVASATLPPTQTPVPTVIPTPLPPLDPGIYRAQTMSALRQLAANLELWLDANNRLARDASLMQQPEWRAQAQQALDQASASAWTLAQVGPPPPEYAVIDSMLDQISAQVEALRGSYQQGIVSGDLSLLQAAGDTFLQLSDTLTQAAALMAQSGWSVE